SPDATRPPIAPPPLSIASVSATSGALALRRLGQGWEFTPTRPPGYDRPWAKAATETRTQTPATHGPRPTPRDATPAVEDLEPGDANAPTRE
ncbi:MAG: hypothetical protein WB820_22450, partial [Rhodoplanes sp.]